VVSTQSTTRYASIIFFFFFFFENQTFAFHFINKIAQYKFIDLHAEQTPGVR
jgi:hypothetical protein